MKVELFFDECGIKTFDTDMSAEEVRDTYCGKYIDIGTDDCSIIDKVILVRILDDNGEIIRTFNVWDVPKK
jgi:hypothetical protein